MPAAADSLDVLNLPFRSYGGLLPLVFGPKWLERPGSLLFKKPQRFELENMLARFRVMSSLPRFRFSAIHVVLFDRRYVLPLLLANLLFLWLSRGHYVAGWELLGVADGKRLVDGLGLLEGFHGAREAAREVTYWNATDSLLFGYLPGIAASYLPWLYWGHLYLFLAVVFFSWLFCRQFGIRPVVFVSVVLASPALLTYSIVAYPYMSGIFSHILALVWVFGTRNASGRFLLFVSDLIVVALLVLASFHLYEVAQAFFIVFVCAAITLSDVGRVRRVWWLILSVAAWKAATHGAAIRNRGVFCL